MHRQGRVDAMGIGVDDLDIGFLQGWQIRWIANKYDKNTVKYADLYRILLYFTIFFTVFFSRPNVSANLGFWAEVR